VSEAAEKIPERFRANPAALQFARRHGVLVRGSSRVSRLRLPGSGLGDALAEARRHADALTLTAVDSEAFDELLRKTYEARESMQMGLDDSTDLAHLARNCPTGRSAREQR